MLATLTAKLASMLLGFITVSYITNPILPLVLDQAGLDACCHYLLKCKDVKLKGHWEPYLKHAETHAVLKGAVCVCVCIVRACKRSDCI